MEKIKNNQSNTAFNEVATKEQSKKPTNFTKKECCGIKDCACHDKAIQPIYSQEYKLIEEHNSTKPDGTKIYKKIYEQDGYKITKYVKTNKNAHYHEEYETKEFLTKSPCKDNRCLEEEIFNPMYHFFKKFWF